jgi:hypothetical protein
VGWGLGFVARGFGGGDEKVQREEPGEEVDVGEFELPTAVV